MLNTAPPADDDAPARRRGAKPPPATGHARLAAVAGSPRAATELPARPRAVVIAAITSCTNTSNPAVLMGAGLLAKKAVERGLGSKPWVKTSLAPGARW